MKFTISLIAGALLTLAALSSSSGASLYVSSYDQGVIAYASAGGSPSSFASAGLNSTQGTAVDLDGNVYVSNANTNKVLRYNSAGVLDPSFSVSGLSGPTGLAINSVGVIYAASFNNNAIYLFGADGVSAVFANAADGVGGARGLAFDNGGNLYVANYTADNVLKIDHDGNASVFVSTFSKPNGIAVDSAGNVYVSSEDTGVINKYTAANTGTQFASGLSGAYGLAYDGASTTLFVAQLFAGNVLAFDSLGGNSVYASGISSPTFVTVAAVPEPATILLLGVGLLGIVILRCRQSVQ